MKKSELQTVELREGGCYMLRNGMLVGPLHYSAKLYWAKLYWSAALVDGYTAMWEPSGASAFFFSEQDAQYDCIAEVFPCV